MQADVLLICLGIRGLRQSALMKAAHGVTSLAEINRVTKD
ncbi:pilus assembly protein [Xanthomonas prunicola]|uniref:Pilus assembly protein n=1 Tax=Xanthomonas prunicola TaxID=2053930 RepID=A0A9Q9MRU9_9XANT|nr:pilus assembly protein [Xanthomonas prunicola]UXA62357.1 pilus assembly protein [Xanthomonas prunicola]UXA64559.1 pilus assembly protein [Xanthomonas prunicola]UXA68148.1 pilus assembly protein [Xanthomonas prunicola]